MMKSTLRITIALLAFSAAAYSQNRIYGQVLTTSRSPVPQLYVELINDVNRIISRTRTDGSGNFIFVGMGTGRFNVRVLPGATDFEEQTQEVQITSLALSNLGSSDSQQVIFYLRTRRDAAAKPAVKGVIFAQEIPKDAEKYYEKAVADLDANRTDLGIAGLQDAVKAFPDYFLANDRLGVELLKRQKWQEARDRFARAAHINERSANSWYGLAFCEYALGSVEKAVEAARKATVINPDSPEMALILGIALRKERQFTDAEQALLKAKKLAGDKSPDTYWNLALLYRYDLKKNKQAADELENYLRVKPDHPNAELLKKLIRQLRTGA
jgi:tetratricopeptide (TPR) repeat protein